MKTITDTKSPPLRFKDDQGKEFPEWEVNSLKQLGETYGGLSGKSKDDFGDGKKYVQYLQVFESSRVKLENCGFVRILESEKQHRVFKGDVLFTVSSETRDEVGISSVVLDDIDELYLNSFCFGLRLESNELSPDFARYLFRNHEFRREIFRLSQGSTRFNLSKKAMMGISLFVPHQQEQQKISNFLSPIDTRIEQLVEKRSLFERFKKGLMQKFFNQEIRFKDAQGNEYQEWEYKVIKEIGEIVTGKTPSTADKSLWNGNLKFITPTDISDARKYQANVERYIRKSKNTRIIPPYSIIYTCIASIGKICISTENCATNQQINAIIPFSGICNEYVYYCLLNATPRIKATQGNSTVPIINKSQFGRIKLLFPCFEEQQKIAEFFSSIDRKIELISEQISQTRQFKKGLLQQMFV